MSATEMQLTTEVTESTEQTTGPKVRWWRDWPQQTEFAATYEELFPLLKSVVRFYFWADIDNWLRVPREEAAYVLRTGQKNRIYIARLDHDRWLWIHGKRDRSPMRWPQLGELRALREKEKETEAAQ